MMTKNMTSLVLALAWASTATTARTAESTRKAEIEDTSGVKTTVNIAYPADLAIQTAGFKLNVPLPQTASIERKGDAFDVVYQWRGKEHRASGTLVGNFGREVTFGGKSDFGDFSLSASSLKELIFKTPSQEEERKISAISRKVEIEDITGVKVEVASLRSYSGLKSKHVFPNAPTESIEVHTPDYWLAIPLGQVASIQSKGDAFNIVYQWRGKEQKVLGTLDCEFSDSADFGPFVLAGSKLKQLTFLSPPLAESEPPPIKPTHTARISLKNGGDIAITSIARHYSYYSTAGYLIGGETHQSYATDFRFKRGDSDAAVTFDALSKLEFGADNTFTVTLRNGNSASGKAADVYGWSGRCDKGMVYVPQGAVIAIEFQGNAIPTGGSKE